MPSTHISTIAQVVKEWILSKIFKSSSTNEDTARRDFILNVLLIGVIGIFGAAVIHNGVEQLIGKPNSISLSVLVLMLGFFGILYALSKRGHGRKASFFLIGIVLLFAAYMGFVWGIDLPASILLYVLGITMSGVLISTRAAFVTTSLVIGYLWIVGGMQANQLIFADRSWANVGWHAAEITIGGLILLVIAAVSWLENREIEKLLSRARRSEHELREERDLLEVRIAERTEELRKLELDRMSQAYRFVEFGRVAGSIFHDLSSPLTALSLNIESIAKDAHSSPDLATFNDDITRAQNAAIHMQKLMESMRRHLAREGKKELFDVSNLIVEVIQILESRARTQGVRLHYDDKFSQKLYGDPVSFLQVITNIVSNAVDAFPDTVESSKFNDWLVTMGIEEVGNELVVTISDNGPGIQEEVLERIFEPFFSTKQNSGGIGIGLSIAKRIVERSFAGRIKVNSVGGKGTSFILIFPSVGSS